jgi:uncharacterized membrane protein
MIGVARAALRLVLAATAVGWIVDRVLRHRAGGEPPAPTRSLIVIDAPIERVWSVLADVEGQPRWMTEMTEVRLLDAGPLRVGTRGQATVRILGMTTTDPVTITAFEAPTRFAIRHEGAFTGDGVITLEPGPDGSTTIVRWDETLIAPVLPYVWALAAAPVLRRLFQGDLERLRDLVLDPAAAGAT